MLDRDRGARIAGPTARYGHVEVAAQPALEDQRPDAVHGLAKLRCARVARTSLSWTHQDGPPPETKCPAGLTVGLSRPTGSLRQVLGRAFRWTAAGVTAGASAALILHGVVRSRVWGLSALDLHVVAGAACLVLLAAGLAAWFPARRAMHVDPVAVLKSE